MASRPTILATDARNVAATEKSSPSPAHEQPGDSQRLVSASRERKAVEYVIPRPAIKVVPSKHQCSGLDEKSAKRARFMQEIESTQVSTREIKNKSRAGDSTSGQIEVREHKRTSQSTSTHGAEHSPSQSARFDPLTPRLAPVPMEGSRLNEVATHSGMRSVEAGRRAQIAHKPTSAAEAAALKTSPNTMSSTLSTSEPLVTPLSRKSSRTGAKAPHFAPKWEEPLGVANYEAKERRKKAKAPPTSAPKQPKTATPHQRSQMSNTPSNIASGVHNMQPNRTLINEVTSRKDKQPASSFQSKQRNVPPETNFLSSNKMGWELDQVARILTHGKENPIDTSLTDVSIPKPSMNSAIKQDLFDWRAGMEGLPKDMHFHFDETWKWEDLETAMGMRDWEYKELGLEEPMEEQAPNTERELAHTQACFEQRTDTLNTGSSPKVASTLDTATCKAENVELMPVRNTMRKTKIPGQSTQQKERTANVPNMVLGGGPTMPLTSDQVELLYNDGRGAGSVFWVGGKAFTWHPSKSVVDFHNSDVDLDECCESPLKAPGRLLFNQTFDSHEADIQDASLPENPPIRARNQTRKAAKKTMDKEVYQCSVNCTVVPMEEPLIEHTSTGILQWVPNPSLVQQLADMDIEIPAWFNTAETNEPYQDFFAQGGFGGFTTMGDTVNAEPSVCSAVPVAEDNEGTSTPDPLYDDTWWQQFFSSDDKCPQTTQVEPFLEDPLEFVSEHVLQELEINLLHESAFSQNKGRRRERKRRSIARPQPEVLPNNMDATMETEATLDTHLVNNTDTSMETESTLDTHLRNNQINDPHIPITTTTQNPDNHQEGAHEIGVALWPPQWHNTGYADPSTAPVQVESEEMEATQSNSYELVESEFKLLPESWIWNDDDDDDDDMDYEEGNTERME